MAKSKLSKKKKAEIDSDISSLIKDLREKQLEAAVDDSMIEGELEGDLEKAELLRDLEFHEFMRPSDSSEKTTPILERMALATARPIFVGGIPQGSNATANTENGDDMKYLSSNSESNEPKYVESSSEIYTPERVNLDDVNRRQTNTFNERSREVFFSQSSEVRSDSPSHERMWKTERFDDARRNDQREETKYEKYKPSHK